ncbi:hypothetical protein MTBSS4_160040 [Magnetospirillum sp. SS-4]|nr:hypothetical protein MTBSS4_160040 [Magnetospirillum sp. SS-4]
MTWSCDSLSSAVSVRIEPLTLIRLGVYYWVNAYHNTDLSVKRTLWLESKRRDEITSCPVGLSVRRSWRKMRGWSARVNPKLWPGTPRRRSGGLSGVREYDDEFRIGICLDSNVRQRRRWCDDRRQHVP